MLQHLRIHTEWKKKREKSNGKHEFSLTVKEEMKQGREEKRKREKKHATLTQGCECYTKGFTLLHKPN